MAEKKLSTQEILALARRQGAAGGTGGDASQGEAPAAPEPAPPAAVDEAPAEAGDGPVAAPQSTADILAAARAQAAAKSGDGSSSKKPAEKPKSTSDILAAARAQGASGAPAAKPTSTADILAAARAQGKSGGAGKPAAGKAAPAAKGATAAKSAVPATVAADHPPIQEMVAAVKQAQRGELPAPKLPGQPPKPKLPEPKKISRRRFADYLAIIVVTPFAAAWSIMAGIGGLWALLGARFMMPNMVLELPSRFKIGPPSDFPLGVVNEKFKASRGVWVVHSDQYGGQNIIYALASVCTHLGCTPNWLEGEQKFKCPCHGSGFYITGINFEGPAPRPLERVGLKLAEDGMLEVDKSLKFQEELGQWSDPKSYVEIA